MPHITEHAPKVSTRSVEPYARESSRKKLQTDTQTHTYKQTHTQTDCRKPLFSRFRLLHISLELNFSHDANTLISWDMEVDCTICQLPESP